MPEKPPRPPHRDYSMPSKKITQPGLPAVIIEAEGHDRSDPTPPPRPGTVTNEDLAMQNRSFDKRLVVVETRTERLPSIEDKVDKLLLLKAEKENEREILSYDVTRAHMEMQTKQQVADVEVKTQGQIATIKNDADQKAYERKIKLRAAGIASTIATVLATGVTILAHHC